MFERIKNHLSDNSGDAYIEKLILILMAFVVGGILLAALDRALGGTFAETIKRVIQGIFNW